MDRAKCRILRQEMVKSLADFEKKYGVKVESVGGGKFDDTSISFKVEISEVAENGKVQSREAKDFKFLCGMYDLEPEDLGAKFRQGNHVFTIKGINPKRPKFPINADRDDGRSFKFTANQVKAALTRRV